MQISPELTDPAIARLLGGRLASHRIAAGLTQAELAAGAGIGKRTLERAEAGQGIELVTLIRLLRTLELLEGLEHLLPELPPSPLEQLRLRGRQRQRVSHPRGPRPAREPRDAAPVKAWTWAIPASEEVPAPPRRTRARKG